MNPNVLNVRVFDSPQDAPNYNRDELDTRSADLTDLYIINKGTVNQQQTVDLIFRDKEDNKFVAMITAKLLRAALAQ